MNGIKNIYDESQMIRDLLSKLFFDRLQKYQSILLRNALYRVGVYYLNRNFIKFIFKNEKLNRTIKKNIRKINFTATNFYIGWKDILEFSLLKIQKWNNIKKSIDIISKYIFVYLWKY